jgi:hypothetical protein
VENQNIQEITVVVHSSADLTFSTSGSYYSAAFNATPSGAANWSNFAALWDEYRLLGFEVEFVPINQYQTTSASYPSGLVVVDHTDTTVLADATAACKYESVKLVSFRHRWKESWKMNGIEESVWVDTSSPATFGSIKIVSTSTFTSSNLVGSYLHTFRVQFRGTGL